MKIRILSDLHLEFGRWRKCWSAEPVDQDLVLLAGDVAVGLEGLAWALGEFDCPVAYVFGNHEHYGQRTLPKLLDKARERSAGTHVHVLENESFVFGGVRILGATLWTDYALFGDPKAAMDLARSQMNDYSKIFLAHRGPLSMDDERGCARRLGKRLTPESAAAFHRSSRAWLEERLAEPSDGSWSRTVVLTHHAPSLEHLPPERRDDPLSPAYASNLDPLLDASDLWVHGHIHDRLSWRRGAAWAERNPRGYAGAGEAQGFDPRLTVDFHVEDPSETAL